VITVNVRQIFKLCEDVENLPDDEIVELEQIPEWDGTLEMRLPGRELGDFIFRDGTTGY
jgi:hypothetical protein